MTIAPFSGVDVSPLTAALTNLPFQSIAVLAVGAYIVVATLKVLWECRTIILMITVLGLLMANGDRGQIRLGDLSQHNLAQLWEKLTRP
ncbi:hypothetical protein Rvan_2524 [Rhodomicrobium vannielii ATCC 17100]|jgi:hypothetical protein|uniref:Uncharacterized protein n=1 Tax=Rhodomicrobium vannielii (strain ATCC 17100 / DSM 162 / LMG 4299 / NCIMB 10020 / ATH 3.1.1) TaxID=648757 RepID=E3I674_RHOVT|nr:hypothetical protein Rvan_2524 [Rhodomicrobium vannielii ATCC 17100]